jgi:serine/threonine-protein kinase
MPELPLDEAQLIAGKYRVERVLGSGAMGVVVAAWHTELAQRVAVKFVRPETMTMQDAEARFRREARAAARIRSEHVGRVFDVGVTEGGLPYMVMEFLDGHDLSEELAERGPLPVEEAVGNILQAIEALAEAHAAGIIHRDLKPANLFLAIRPDDSRIVKVLDFGVSKAGESRPGDMALTQAATLIGSPLYMSPEQMRSARDVDGRSDIWSLGVILFELLCGRPPFIADSVGELMDAMLRAPPSLRQFRPDAPEGLERLVTRCLQRSPDDRFSDVAVLARALSEFAPAMRVHAERARRVLRGAELPSNSRSSLIETEVAALPGVSTSRHLRPTVAAWGTDHNPFERRPLRRLLIVSALVGVLVIGGVAVLLAKKGDALSTGGTPSATAPTPHAQGALPAHSTSAVPTVTPEVDIATGEPVGSAPSEPSASAAKKGPKGRPPHSSVKIAAPGTPVRPSPDEPAAPAIPDFGGRR